MLKKWWSGKPIALFVGFRNEDIVAGDKVWAYDEGIGKQGLKAVKRLFRNITGSWHHIRVAGKCTVGHPFYAVGKGLVAARELKAGDKCLRLDGKEGITEGMGREARETRNNV
ncbi:MAG: hypothetical protein LBK69_02570 [Syntrophomonadaceae bacterium]|nr:hypothetical protein [Syntrophomonadaceae bacterium]